MSYDISYEHIWNSLKFLSCNHSLLPKVPGHWWAPRDRTIVASSSCPLRLGWLPQPAPPGAEWWGVLHKHQTREDNYAQVRKIHENSISIIKSLYFSVGTSRSEENFGGDTQHAAFSCSKTQCIHCGIWSQCLTKCSRVARACVGERRGKLRAHSHSHQGSHK